MIIIESNIQRQKKHIIEQEVQVSKRKMIKSNSKRKDNSQPLISFKSLPLSQAHKCYFHPSNQITKFCTNKKCTLPLCQKCLNIHVKQHAKQLNQLGKQNIVDLRTAYDTASKGLKNIVDTKTQKIEIIKRQCFQAKENFLNLIQQAFQNINTLIQNRQNEAKILSEKYCKIKKGSLKTLIFYFADQQPFKLVNQFKFSLNSIEKLEKVIQQVKDIVQKLETNDQKEVILTNENYLLPEKLQNLSKLKAPNQKFSSLMLNRSQIIPIVQQVSKEQQSVNNLQTSKDFAQILRNQRNRLQTVRNRNISFANNYSSNTDQTFAQKYCSRSVDNFISNRLSKDSKIQNNKNYQQDRPLQVTLIKDRLHSVQKTSENKNNELINNQQQLDKIRKKYIGDDLESKEKFIKLPLRQEYNSSNQENIHSLGLKDKENLYNNKTNFLDTKFLDKNDIRIHFGNKLNEKSFQKSEKQNYQNICTRLTDKTINTQSKDLVQDYKKHLNFIQTVNSPRMKPSQKSLTQKNQEFTLNKNYQYRSKQPQERYLMSSIKRQLKAEYVESIGNNVQKSKTFFDSNKCRLGSFDVREEKQNQKDEDGQKLRSRINDFIFDKNLNSIKTEEQRIQMVESHKIQNRNQMGTEKSYLYEQSKSKTETNNSSKHLRQQILRNKYDQKNDSQKSFSKDRVNSYQKKKGEKRFHYIEDLSLSQPNQIQKAFKI